MFEDILLVLMEFVPDHFKRKEMYYEALRNNPWALRHVPDYLKMQDMYNEVVLLRPYLLQYVSDHFKTEETRIKALEVGPWLFKYIPDHLNRNMCDKVVKDDSSSLQYVPDWFVTQQQIDLWHDDYHDDDGDHWDNDNDEDKFFECHDGYQK